MNNLHGTQFAPYIISYIIVLVFFLS